MKPEAKVKQSKVVSRRSDQTQCLFRKSPFELSTVAIVKSKTKQIGMSLQKEIHVIEGTHELKLPKIDNNLPRKTHHPNYLFFYQFDCALNLF